MIEWKVGDYAMVEIVEVGLDGSASVGDALGGQHWVVRSYLRPLPPAITPEERAVVEAALWWDKSYGASVAHVHLKTAVNALIASRTPPDPLAELVAALDECGVMPDRVERALTAARKAVAK